MQAPPRGQIILFSIATCITITTSQLFSDVIYVLMLGLTALPVAHPSCALPIPPRHQRHPRVSSGSSQDCIALAAGGCGRLPLVWWGERGVVKKRHKAGRC
jgi:hypothetical protein